MRKFLVFALLLTSLFALPVFAQDGDTSTYVTQDNLVIEVPANWTANDAFGFLIIANTDDIFAEPEDNPDLVVMTVFYGTPDDLDTEFGFTADNIDGFADIFRQEASADETIVLEADENITIGDRDAIYLLATVDGEASAIYAFEIDGQFFLVSVNSASEDTLNASRATVEGMIASMRFDADATPTTPIDSIDSTGSTDGSGDSAAPIDPIAASSGEGAFVWLQSLESDPDDFDGIGALSDIALINDTTAVVSDSFSLVLVDIETGEISARVTSNEVFFISGLGSDVTNSLVWTTDFSGIIALDAEMNVAATATDPIFDEGFAEEIAVGSDGTVYVFLSLYDDASESFSGFVATFTTSGEPIAVVDVTGETDEFGFSTYTLGVNLVPQDDGTVVLYDSDLSSKVISVSGEVLAENASLAPDEFIVVSDLSVAPDGTIYVLTFDELRRYSADGELLNIIGAPQADESVAFVAGDIPSFGSIAAIDGNRVLITGSNFDNFSMIALIDFSLVE